MSLPPPAVSMGGKQTAGAAEPMHSHPSPSASSKTVAPVNVQEDNVLCGSNPFDVCIPCNTCFVVPERTHYVELYFGSYHGTITKPGCYCRSTFAIELRQVKTDLCTFDLPNTKVLDARGSPIVVSGIITFWIVDARAAAIDVANPHQYIRDQAPAILKRIVSMYPYESDDPNVPSLRTETSEVTARMRDTLQARCTVAGIRIESFSINELSYAPEIASTMLKRQQAEALISARRAIVSGAKEIAKDAVADVGESMTAEQKAGLLSNLLVVLVGDKDVTPTITV